MDAKKVAIAVVLGVSAFPVGALVDGLLGAARSPTPPATFVIMGAYLALCQFLLVAKGVGLRASLPTLLGMAAPSVLGCILMAVAETRDVVLRQGLPLLAAGGLGPLAGSLVAAATAARRAAG